MSNSVSIRRRFRVYGLPGFGRKVKTARGFFGNPRVFDTVVPESVRFREAAALGKTLFEHASYSRGAVAFQQLAQEVIGA